MGTLLQEIQTLNQQAMDAARAASTAQTVDEVKRHAEAVFAAIWGQPSGLMEDTGGAWMPGWKEQWQVSGAEFDEAFVERYGSEPPTMVPSELGIIGRGRAVRKQLEAVIADDTAPDSQRQHAGHVLASLNNFIGWMKIDDGVTKAERQPRVDLTREWDAPSAFWNSTADTGWLFEVFSQAINILKTDYEGDAATARRHAGDLVTLLEKATGGVDANNNGQVEPAMMEGGLRTALEHAGYGGFN